MSALKTQYILEVTKTGDGVALAVRDFEQLDAAAKKANASLAGASAGQQTLLQSGKATKEGIQALNSVLVLVGLQSFPQLTAAGMLGKQMFDAIRVAAMAFVTTTVAVVSAVAGVVAMIALAVVWFQKYKAEQEEIFTKSRLDEQTANFASDLKSRLEDALTLGEITMDTFQRLSKALGTLAGNQQVRDFFKDLNGGDAQDRIGALEQEIQLMESRNQLASGTSYIERNNTAILQARLQLYRELRAENLITEDQMNKLSKDAEINFNRTAKSALDLNKKMTDLQQLGRSVAQTFAGQLSSAIVDVFSEGGKALQKFAAQFFSTVAQMILQLLILRTLKSAFPGLAAEGGTFMAAGGGMFPRAMATGGLALAMAAGGVAPTYAADGVPGVQSVSQATYFPRFNVVAGEAGREMLTVLAKPRFMELGGVQAVVGNAGANRLAITSADQLAANGGAGAGGHLTVEIRHTPETEARIIENSVKNAVVRVTQDMGRDSKLSRTTKQLR
jgi:hypothetical protein